MANQDELGVSRRVVMVCDRSDLVFNGACSCGAQGPDGDSAEEAIEKWNRRAGEQESAPVTVRILAVLCILLAALLVRENERARQAEEWADAVAAEAEIWLAKAGGER